ncbi:uncharacterized protein (DUF1800 family) [Trinickia symbiotica]|uniref:DUF1800 domain-containing protein n=1 Tax=Trinickia symbiotica TaxID=863227 RepID=A0A2N7X169_9BURK|nr:DUF1800 domain-containing protein [Trinickia symbiotica]PMS35360.1 DUF1800 domain-containing protein [Trinickia symbiotica]PPK45370.1 uncharacterized protein (DUF1800 family) [Trinickia symbiotica]
MADKLHLTAAGIALNRFGLGARPDDAAPADPRAWLLEQLDAYEPWPAAWAGEPGANVAFERYAEARREAAAKAASEAAASRGASQGGDAMANRALNPAPNRHPERARGQPANAAIASQAAGQTPKQAARQAVRREVRDAYLSAVDARVNSALATNTPFVERLVHFWANHFAISTEKPEVAALAGAFEAEAIRPYVLGTFEELVVAVERHPAMQIFLDQVRSVGPDSVAALRASVRDPAHPRGLNENLAREIMELHTLGVRTGYTQDDVTEFARALTGWSVVGPQGGRAGGMTKTMAGMGKSPASRSAAPQPVAPQPAAPQPAAPQPVAGNFIFRPELHEPGQRTIMGRRYAEEGEAQAVAVLHDLAASRATARHIAFKLARHFVSDNPSPSTIERLASAFETSGGDLPTVYRALIASPEAWAPLPVKFKTPWDWTISALRGIGVPRLDDRQHAAPMLTQLGQPVWRPGSPAGYDDVAASWAAPDALMRRVELAQRLAARVGDGVDARELGPRLMGGPLEPATALEISRAESAPTALALLLVSPDFQRR